MFIKERNEYSITEEIESDFSRSEKADFHNIQNT